MMEFQRFGNAFVAQVSVASGEERDDLYVVSLYAGGWAPYYRTADMTEPKQIGLYGLPGQEGLNQAKQACEDFSRGIKPHANR